MINSGSKLNKVDEEEIGDAIKLKNSVRRLKTVAGVSITTAFVVCIIALVELFLILKLAYPETIQTITYLNEEGVVVSEDSVSSIPTISQSSAFLRSCIRKTFKITSGSYQEDLKDSSYCYDSRTEVSVAERIKVLVDQYFLSRSIVGGLEVKDLQVSYINSLTGTGTNVGFCSVDIRQSVPEAQDCRAYSFEADLDAINYQTGIKSPLKYKGNIALVITNRASDERGQYIHILQAE